VRVVDNAIHLGVDPPQHHENNVVGFLGHCPYSAAIDGTAPSEVEDQVY
jgi:hypothetical protein